MEAYDFVIPEDSPVRQTLDDCVLHGRIIIISGLPGVGKSLYVNEFYHLAKLAGKQITVIQWDQARKAFETEEIFKDFPLVDGQVHNAVKLMAGAWLMDEVKKWIIENEEGEDLLLIEAPLVGHRFLELVLQSDDEVLEPFLSSEKTRVVMPIPSIEIRNQIEMARAAQVKEDAKVWFGAKPSVMKIIWKMTCEISVALGYEMDMSDDPPYSPEVYHFVFSEVLKHRHFKAIYIDEIFKVKPGNESSLHALQSLVASDEDANDYAKQIKHFYSSEEMINEIVDNWYNT